MPSLKRSFVLFAALLALRPASASAQILEPPDVSTMRVKFGPLYLVPALALTNAGIDTNVFDVPDDAGPQKDFTATIEPQTALWLPVGRTWVNGHIREDIVWFEKFASERSVNGVYDVNWVAPLTRVAFQAGAEYVNTHERPGYEIDARTGRAEKDVNAALEFRTFAKTFLGARFDRRTIGFDDSAEFLGVNLRNELHRTATTAAFTVRNQLTPLTAFTLDGSHEEDRFEFDHLRDSNSNGVRAGFQFNQLALLKGGMQFGWRDFQPQVAGVPGFKGFTSAVDLSYVLLGTTRMALIVNRDVQYSYDVNQPYYVQSGFTATVTQQVFGPVDIQGRAGAARMAYRTRTDAAIADADRVDHTRDYGGGAGFHMGEDVRIGFNVDRVKRLSALDNRTYHGLRYGTSVTYGF